MKNIGISVRNTVATNMNPDKQIICGNKGYTVTFDFDSEWDAEPQRTARFVYHKGGKRYYEETNFTGDTASVPMFTDVDYVLVGVYAGDLTTTTPARVLCNRSILCGDPIEMLTEAQKQSVMAELAKNVYITGAEVNAENHLILNLSNGKTMDAGEIPVGSTGANVPDGGTAGQVLTKNSDADGDASWQNPKGGNGPGLFQLTVDDAGNLWMHTYGENDNPVLEYDPETGGLYYVMEV